MNKTDKILVLFIYVSIFVNSIVFFKDPFEFYIGYLVFLLLIPFLIQKHETPKGFKIIFFVLLLQGLYGIFMGNNTFPLFLKVFAGLFMSYVFYYYVISQFKFDLNQLFEWYLKGAYLVSLLGMIQFVSYLIGFKWGYDYGWLFNKWGVVKGGNFGIRINSVCGEPSQLATVLAPAFFVSITKLFRIGHFELDRTKSIIIILCFLMTFSSVGYLGILIVFFMLLINYGFFRYFLIFIPLLILVFNFLIKNVPEFSERYRSTIDIFSSGEFEIGKTHGSSIILYNNYIISLNSFLDNFPMGSGLGSHPIAFNKYSVTKHIREIGFDLNSMDANSMLLRLLSETGLFGIILFFSLIFKCYISRNACLLVNDNRYWILSNSILVMIILTLLRQGHYFLNGFPFFVWLYYINYQQYIDVLAKEPSPVSMEANSDKN